MEFTIFGFLALFIFEIFVLFNYVWSFVVEKILVLFPYFVYLEDLLISAKFCILNDVQ